MKEIEKSNFKKGDKVTIDWDYCRANYYEILSIYSKSDIEYAKFTNMNYCQTKFLIK